MSDETDIERWRKDLSGRDPMKMLNALSTVANSGLPEGVALLEQAGEFVPAEFWTQTIAMAGETLTVREYRDRFLVTLRASLPHAALPGHGADGGLLAFISYSTADRVRATQLAAALAQADGTPVFLDHWQLGPGDLLSERLSTSISKAASLVLLISKASLASHWVRKEIELAVKRAAEDQRFRIVPVRLDDTPLPEHLADMVYVDGRSHCRMEVVVQAVLDRVRGASSFSQRVNEMTAGKAFARNPYEKQHVAAGRSLLPLLASVPELAVDVNQRWLLWELMHEVLPDYRCTLKLEQDSATDDFVFEFVDRWLQTVNVVRLSEEQVHQGLWAATIDPSSNNNDAGEEARLLGSTGRISFNSDCSSRTSTNPIHPPDPASMQSVLAEVREAMARCGQPARESFIFDFQSIVSRPGWRKIELVVGGVHTTLSLAHSAMVRADRKRDSGPGVTYELWDEFLGAMKATELFEDQLSLLWEADVDLFSPAWETLLGLG